MPRTWLISLVLAATACTRSDESPPADHPVAPSERRELPAIPQAQDHGQIISAGQPAPEHFAPLFKRGVRTVINLRTPQETKYDEASEATRVGMKYVPIPVAGAADLTNDNVDALHQALEEAAGGRVLLHCGSSNRVGALMALRAQRHLGKTVPEALQVGRAYGLKALEDAVRAKLEREAQAP